MTIGILGAGLTGLALAHRLPSARVLEKEERPGGLCRSYAKDGFCYDVGGHVLFSRDEQTLASMIALLGENAARHYRRNEILFRGRVVRYPFENGLPDLALRDRLACALHYAVRRRRTPGDFAEWCVARFGRGIARRYLIPYSRKIWKTPLAEISTRWVERIPDPSPSDILKGALGIRTEGYRHQLHFHYPKRGGIEALIKAFAAGKEIECNFGVRRIERGASGWVVSDGARERRFDTLLSTIPVTELVDALADAPERIRTAAAGLRSVSLVVVLVGMRAASPPTRFGLYVPQEDVIFHRVCCPPYLGRAYAPEGTTSLIAEITALPGDAILAQGDGAIVRRAVDGLVRIGLAREEDVVTTDVRRERHAYVVDTHDRAERMDAIRHYLIPRGIFLCGRFAEFEYLNMDACVARANQLARSL